MWIGDILCEPNDTSGALEFVAEKGWIRTLYLIYLLTEPQLEFEDQYQSIRQYPVSCTTPRLSRSRRGTKEKLSHGLISRIIYFGVVAIFKSGRPNGHHAGINCDQLPNR